MKRFRIVMILIIMICGILAIDAMAQSAFSVNARQEKLENGVVYHFTGNVDGATDTIYSNVFSLSRFDAESFYTYPLGYTLKLSGGAASTQKVTALIMGSNDGTNYAVIDTLSNADSVTTLIKTTHNLNNGKYPKYKLALYGTGTNLATGSGIGFVMAIYAYKQD